MWSKIYFYFIGICTMSSIVLDNSDCEFAYNEKVKIIDGLYRGRIGKFKNIDKGKYIVEIKLDERDTDIACKKEHLKKHKSFF